MFFKPFNFGLNHESNTNPIGNSGLWSRLLFSWFLHRIEFRQVSLQTRISKSKYCLYCWVHSIFRFSFFCHFDLKTKKNIGHFQAFSFFVTSNYQITNFVSPIFSTNLSQLEQLKKKTNFLLVFFSILDQWKDDFLFHLLKLRKICGKNWGKQD